MSSQPVLQSIRDREFAYLLSNSRLKVKQKTAKIDIGSIHLEAMNEGDAVDLPRWIAEVLISLDICESQEESFSSEVFKAVTREKIAGSDQISALRPDFYLKIRRHLAFATDTNKVKPSTIPEIEKTRSLIYDLMALRLRKILSIAASLSPPTDLRSKLTPEEYQIFDSVYTLLQSWRSMTMDGNVV
jgi:GINS complex protein helical bundle domain